MSILISKTYLKDIRYVIKENIFIEDLRECSILITGGTGLIGSAIVDLLLMANLIKSLHIKIYIACRDINRAKERFADFPDKKILNSLIYVEYDSTKDNTLDFCVDYIIHAASIAHPKSFVDYPVDTMISNFDGINDLLGYAKINNVRNTLFVSSSEVYGQKEKLEPLTEMDYGYIDILNPRNAYASSKRAAETVCVSYYKQYGVRTSIVRPGHIYGPTASASDSRVGSAFAYCAAEGRDIVLKSEGTQIRSYCYVLDCATAILIVLLKGEPSVAYNISNVKSIISIRKLAELYSIQGGVNLKVELPLVSERERFNPMENSSLDSHKLESLGWIGLFDAETGISHTIVSLREQKC